MKYAAKLVVTCLFSLCGLFVVLTSLDLSGLRSIVLAQTTTQPSPTPPAANKPANTNAAPATPVPTGGGDKKIKKSFTLGADSLSEYGEVAFDHQTHAEGNYSPDGKSPIGCIECHHTDQPKADLKPPLLTSERDVVLTMATYKSSSQKVNECRSCHFQEGSVPDDKEMPSATYTDGGKSTTKDLNNELAYHINCNTCHDAAFKLRPELKSKPGFATAKDCTICHKAN